MSLSDYLKHLRALRGGVTPAEIEEATGVSAFAIGYIERKYARVGDDDASLARLADYFGVPFEEMLARRERYRKRLTAFLAEMTRAGRPIRLKLRGGEEVAGAIEWSDKLAVALRLPGDGGEVVVYRHSVEEWAEA